MPFTHVPKYPVVDPEPSVSRSIENFGVCDYLTIGAAGGIGYIVGWMKFTKHKRFHYSKYVAVGAMFGATCFCTLSSMQRLMGLFRNDNEVKLYGIMSPYEIAEIERRANIPNLNLIESISEKPKINKA